MDVEAIDLRYPFSLSPPLEGFLYNKSTPFWVEEAVFHRVRGTWGAYNACTVPWALTWSASARGVFQWPVQLADLGQGKLQHLCKLPMVWLGLPGVFVCALSLRQ
jgi:hypothetical protein